MLILKGINDRRKQDKQHLVSAVAEATVLAHLRTALVNVDDPNQQWRRSQENFDEWRSQQLEKVGPKGKAEKKKAAKKKNLQPQPPLLLRLVLVRLRLVHRLRRLAPQLLE